MYETGKSLCTFYMQKLVEAPIFNLVSVLAEAQTFKDWVPLMYRSNIVYEPSCFRKLGEFATTLPWPFSNRSIYLNVVATEVPNENTLIIVMKSV